MSAETLRRAAAAMRERAEAAYPGPWDPRGAGSRIVRHEDGADVVIAADAFPGFGGDSFARTATHIASWHPAVALAVADWLDETAYRWEWVEERELALAVAVAYLGEEAP